MDDIEERHNVILVDPGSDAGHVANQWAPGAPWIRLMISCRW